MDESDVDLELLDAIGPWSELKHEMVAYYATVYSSILSRAGNGSFHHYYIDGYASAGYNRRKNTGDLVMGSPLRVLGVIPPFEKHFFVELDESKFRELRKHCASHKNVEVIHGDANIVLPQQIFPAVRFSRFERAFCLLDPYNEVALDWKTIVAASNTKTIDLLMHFPIYSMNIQVLRKDKNYSPEQAARLTRFWGDESWQEAAYATGEMLFADMQCKVDNDRFVQAFCERLKINAGFLGVSKPIPMKSMQNNTIYYLIFASNNKTGVDVINRVANRFLKVRQPYAVGASAAPTTYRAG